MIVKPKSGGSVPTLSVRTVPLAGRLQAARCARRALSQFLSHRGLLRGPDGQRSDQAESALLVVSELVTNACRHTAGPRHLGMAVKGGRLLLEVGDRSRTVPRPVPPEERGAAGGFGLGLVAELVDDWAVVTSSRGKTIRVTLPLTK
ncbi:ATP-binding protein [Streptomyces sp. NPDC006475]|uniref:ATP-binding protein n=1 Tax=Streptomyces sp. NPDC006475 TaxID=3155719 RepID=UPI0033BB349D